MVGESGSDDGESEESGEGDEGREDVGEEAFDEEEELDPLVIRGMGSKMCV